MKACDFDFTKFREWRLEREEKIRQFLSGKTGTNIFLKEAVGCSYYHSRTPEESLSIQLDGIKDQMALKSDFVPYMAPWFGVGVYANAFGAKYIWPLEGVKESPQTHYVAFSEEDAARLECSAIEDAEIMKLVIDAIDYFLNETRGEIPICCTDTQSPIDNATLIWETASFFTAMTTNPELVHRILDKITDLVIRFTRLQLSHLGDTWARPGHIMLSATGSRGISISDDNIVMVGPDDYSKFAVSYNEMISDAFGGLAVHSCGNYVNQLPALVKTKGLIMIDGAFSKISDPTPNQDFEIFRETLKGTGIILQARMGDDWPEILPKLYHPDLKIILSIPAPAKNEPIDKNIILLDRMLQK